MRCRSLPTLTLTLATALLAAASPASAMSTFFGQNYGTHPPPEYMTPALAESAFVGMLGGSFQTEGFESFADKEIPTQIFAGGPVIGVLSDSVADGGKVRVAPLDDAGNRGFPTEGSNFWKNETTSTATDELFRVTFSDPVRAFGFYATAWSTQSTVGATALILELLLANDTVVATLAIPHSQLGDLEGSVFYYGVISDVPFVKAALRNSVEINGGDRIGFDNFTVSTVPEPSTGLLLAMGLLGLAAAGRRRSA
jgi:hypothetical protein